MTATREPLLSVRDLCVAFPSPRGAAELTSAVDGVDFDIGTGETLALVGESGSGKSVTALSILRLLPSEARVEGSIRFAGRALDRLGESELRAIRGREIGTVFQEPMSALDPVMRIGDQVAEPWIVHAALSRREALARARDMLARVGFPDPERTLRAFPHELSGGMRQRALLAMAIALRPKLLLLDEPTTALDTVTQAQILDLLGDVQRELGLAMLLVTHDLALVAERAERTAVMYGGRIVEVARTRELLANPAHPYTALLLRSSPGRARRGERLQPIAGSVPADGQWPSGCRFRTRCPLARERCAQSRPALDPLPEAAGSRAVDSRRSACFFAAEVAAR